MFIPETQNPNRRYGKFIHRLVLDIQDAEYDLCAGVVISPTNDWWQGRYNILKNNHLTDGELIKYKQETKDLSQAVIKSIHIKIIESGMELFQQMLLSGLKHDNKYTIVRGTVNQLINIMDIPEIVSCYMWPLQKIELVGNKEYHIG